MFDFAVLAIGRADQADRITAVALNFEMKRKRFTINGHQRSTLTTYIKHKMRYVWLQIPEPDKSSGSQISSGTLRQLSLHDNKYGKYKSFAV